MPGRCPGYGTLNVLWGADEVQVSFGIGFVLVYAEIIHKFMQINVKN